MTGQNVRPLIALLGASGLLGTAITRELCTRRVRLRLVGRRPTAVPARRSALVEVRTVDLTAPGAMADAVVGADAVIHLVAHMTGAGTWRVAAGDSVAERVNLGLAHDLVDAIREQRRSRPPIVVFAGSMSQAGRAASTRLTGTEPDEPLTAYDRQKLAAEREIAAATADGLVRGTTLRLATLYSRGTDASGLDRGVVAAMTRRALAGHPLTMWHDGSVKRDLLCIDDAARGFLAALDRPEAVTGRSWLVGTGQATSIADLFATIAKVVSACTGLPPVPVVSVPPAEHSMPTDLLDFVLDPSAFQQAAQWSARVPLPEGLAGLAAAIAGESAPHGTADPGRECACASCSP